MVRYGIVACMAAMVAAVAYGFIRLYVFNVRVDAPILIVNVGVFSASAAALVYLSWKQKEMEEGELFRD
jgi:hypothetical protein